MLRVDGVPVGILDGVGGINPDDITDIKPGGRRGSALQAEEAGDVVAMVLGLAGDTQQQNAAEEIQIYGT